MARRLWGLIAEAQAAGELDLPREDILFFATPHEREVSVNSTRAGGLGIDPWEITRAEWVAPADARDRPHPHDARARLSEGEGTVIERLPPREAYDIPLRCLLPRGLDRVMTAGRGISGTHEAHSPYRVTPIAMATGHAAGVCAALAARAGRIPRQVAGRGRPARAAPAGRQPARGPAVTAERVIRLDVGGRSGLACAA